MTAPPAARPSARDLHPAGRDLIVDEAPGVDEVGNVPWPLVLGRKRKGRRPEPSNRWAVLAVALTGLFTVGITITLLAVSLVDIAADLGSSETTLSWIITGPMLAFGIVGPAFGKAGDLWGHKKVFLVGLLGAAVFAFATAAAWDAASLIAFRTLSASFGAACGPPAVALINRLFDTNERVKALGYYSLIMAGAPVLGVVIGGPLVAAVGWRVIFLVQAPMCLVALGVAAVLLPETERGRRARFDVPGAVLLAVSITTLLLAVNRASEWGWTSPIVLAGFIVAPLALLAFVAVERRVADPLIPLEWVRRRNVAGPVASQFLANFAYMGGFVLTPILLQTGLGYSATVVGFMIVCRPLAFAIAAPTSGFLTVRVGERVAGVSGALVVLVSMLGLAVIGGGTAPWFIAAALALSGVGLGLSSPALTAAIANAVDDADLGVAAAVQQLTMQVGSVIGIQVMQTVQAGTEPSLGLVESYGAAFYVGAAVAGAAALAALVIRPSLGRHAVESPVPDVSFRPAEVAGTTR